MEATQVSDVKLMDKVDVRSLYNGWTWRVLG